MNANTIARDFDHFLEICKQPTDPKYVKKREGWRDRNGNVHMVSYVEWTYVADFLDAVVPEWSHGVENVALIGDTFVVVVSITVFGVTRQGLGTGSAESEMGIKKAEHDALKRAAVKFGIARELYNEEDNPISFANEHPQQQTTQQNRPASASQAFVPHLEHKDICTQKQLQMFENLCRSVGQHPNNVVKALYGEVATEAMLLSRMGCSRAIDYVKGEYKL